MRPMREFDPCRPARVHDRLNDVTFDWRTAWADKYRALAVLERDGIAYFYGLMLDGWEPAQRVRIAISPSRKRKLRTAMVEHDE
jgi:hypothetical protein